MAACSLPCDPPQADRISSGEQICLTRMQPLGQPGDVIRIGTARFRIADVIRMDLYQVMMELYRLEGFQTREAFSSFWEERYPEHCTGTERVYVHFFARIGGA